MSPESTFHFTVKWSKRRKTIGLIVTAEADLVVAAPVGTQKVAIRQAVAKHRSWIERKLNDRREALARIEAGKAYYLGRAYDVRLVGEGQEPVRLIGEEVWIRHPKGSGDIWPDLKNWYKQEAERLVQDRVTSYGTLMKLKAGQVEVRDWKRRWGECQPSRGKMLRFNWRLVLLPLKILDYVVAHELTHLLVPGHPPRFWEKLGRVILDFAERRAWLNRYGSPFLIWELKGLYKYGRLDV
jgi:predicted metal-dependent hydrolase